MNHNQDDNPTRLSDETLLAFLNTGPHTQSNPANTTGTTDTLQPNGGQLSPLVTKPGEGDSEESAGNCLTPALAMRLVLGDTEGEDAEALLTHAAVCPTCGDLLTRSLGTLQGNPSPEETAAIEELAATRVDWQRKLARDLAETSTRRRLVVMRPRFWMGAGAIAAGLVAAAGLFLWQYQTNTPEHQLAKAYEQSRSLELRIPDARFAGFTGGSHTRGVAIANEPAPLLEARAHLARELERAPHDPHLEQLQARADVLEERYGSATDILDRLLATGPVTAELLTDAASAYYQRGLVTGSELDRSTALDYLRRANELAPTDPVILFNEAIVMEDRGQMMNAVEVWNRYITVERDPKWAAEGKRKLAALEQTLNRIKSHESRITQMLATPQAMDSLANDQKKLASLDEELATYELDKLLLVAYPSAYDPPNALESIHSQQARGSPCLESCMAARKLLKAIGSSLEIQHHDSWLTDLISPDIDSLPPATAAAYAQALQLLAQAMRELLTGSAAKGAQMALTSRQLFHQLQSRHLEDKGQAASSLAAAAQVGEERAATEYMVSLQANVDFRNCRTVAQQLRTGRRAGSSLVRYPWIDAVQQTTEKVCDDTPETRLAGRKLELAALRLAEASRYPLLISRIQMRLVDDAENSGDQETTERLTLATLRQQISTDAPIIRIVNTLPALIYVEEYSQRRHMAELSLREILGWYELIGNHAVAVYIRLSLARAEMRIGALKEAGNQMNLAYKERNDFGLAKANDSLFAEPEMFLSNSLLERGDLPGAEHALEQAAAHMGTYSDSRGLRTYASARGQLQLARGRLDEAAQTLESEIRTSERGNFHGGDRTTATEYAQLDHDLYAELSATWLAQGRRPESILALWERFRLRSRGLPITKCPGNTLDCEQPRLLAARDRLGDSILIGQIVLLDRVLVYRLDKNGVTWSQKALPRQDILDTAQTLERAVSSPFTSTETAAKLGTKLGDALLPALPASAGSDAPLLLEPDPMLQNLSWAVLPTPQGPLGIQYSLAELRSILAPGSGRDSIPARSALTDGTHSLVVGASVAADGEPPLPEVLKEANTVDRFLHSSDLLLGERATTATVADKLGTAAIFHFAGHAIQTVNGTELLLSPRSAGESNPWVDGAFLRQHPPRACRLAVLSACATGNREASWNHSLQDIVETLGSLGVPEVVATRWQIDSQAAVPFMDSFYQGLAQGKSVALALTSARRVISTQSLYKNPYYWGAYYLSGWEIRHQTGELHARR